MYAFFITIHIMASLFLIAVILLQAGRGGGLSDSLGGSQIQGMFGTKSSSVLTKLTTISATLFIITCLSLALISSRRSSSLVDKARLPETVPAQASQATEPLAPAPEQAGTDSAVPIEAQGE